MCRLLGAWLLVSLACAWQGCWRGPRWPCFSPALSAARAAAPSPPRGPAGRGLGLQLRSRPRSVVLGPRPCSERAPAPPGLLAATQLDPRDLQGLFQEAAAGVSGVSASGECPPACPAQRAFGAEGTRLCCGLFPDWTACSPGSGSAGGARRSVTPSRPPPDPVGSTRARAPAEALPSGLGPGRPGEQGLRAPGWPWPAPWSPGWVG